MAKKSDSRIELCCAASIAATSPSGRGRASGEGEGEADVSVAPQVTATHPLPAATASDLPRCAGEVKERNKPRSTQSSYPNQSPAFLPPQPRPPAGTSPRRHFAPQALRSPVWLRPKAALRFSVKGDVHYVFGKTLLASLQNLRFSYRPAHSMPGMRGAGRIRTGDRGFAIRCLSQLGDGALPAKVRE